MKIDMPTLIAVNNYRISNAKQISATKVQGVYQKDASSFSSDATLFADVLKATKASINERVATVNADLPGIKETVQNGNYSVPTKDLAINILLNK